MSHHLPDRRRDGYPDSLEYFTAGSEAFTPYGERLVPVFYRNLLQGLEVLLDVGPFETVTSLLQSAIQFLPENQGKKTAEDVSSDGLIPLMELRWN